METLSIIGLSILGAVIGVSCAATYGWVKFVNSVFGHPVRND
jgi:hypothetical protein